MAKKIKFPLEMKDGVMVRTIEELRENFDVEKLVEHYESGKLESWLQDRYYDVELQKISELNREGKKFVPLLCDCFGITVQEEEVSEIDAEFLKRRVEKLNHLKSLTEDKMLLSRVDDIAITQEDLIDLLDSGKSEIYLCEGDFTIPVSVPNKTYTGIFNPTAVIRAVDNVNFKKQNITFNDMVFIWDVSGLTPKDRSYRAERLFMEKQYEKAADICRELVKEDNPRALMLLDRMNGSYIIWNAKEAMECQDRGVQINSIHSLLDNDEWQFIERYKEKLKEIAETGTCLDGFYYGLVLQRMVSCNEEINRDMVELYNREILNHYEKVAESGNAYLQRSMGDLYYNGYGVAQDYQKALEWYQKSMHNGSSWAMEKIAKCYEEGKGTEKDYEKALQLRRKAAELGYVVSIGKIGWHYHNGYGVAQDYQKAMEWYQKAAAQNDAVAQKNIGELYFYGQGVSEDYQKVMEWSQKAAAQNNSDAQNNIGVLYHMGLGVEQNYQKAMEWYQKAAAQNNDTAQYEIGVLYYNGLGVEQNYQKAMEWYQKSAAQNNDTAQYEIGVLYCNGLGVEQNYQKAMEWCQKSAAQNNSDAQNRIGFLYQHGQGVKQDYEKAMEWYQKSAAQNNSTAQSNIGYLYQSGQGVKQDYEKAMEWYQKSAAQNNSAAQFNIGCLYYNGQGVKQDYGKAKEWCQKAADNGDLDAKEALKIFN